MKAAQTLADVTTAYIVNAEGRADLREASYRSRELSLHDALTGLPNRALLMERLEHSLLRGRRSGLTSAVFFVDLDRFKVVNDTFGHRVGDEVLVAVAARLSEVLRPGDTLARVSGDEFVVLCEDLDGPAQADVIVGRLDAAFDQPFALSGTELQHQRQHRHRLHREGEPTPPKTSCTPPTWPCTGPSGPAAAVTRSSTCATSTSPVTRRAWSATCTAC